MDPSHPRYGNSAGLIRPRVSRDSTQAFFSDLVTYLCSGPLIAMVWEGPGVISGGRKVRRYDGRQLSSRDALATCLSIANLHEHVVTMEWT